MNVRFLGTLLLAVLTFFGCDDTTGTLGLEMLPGDDNISAHTTVYDVKTRSFVADSVYAKTSTGYVGKFSDPEFGYYEASFLTELNCTDHFEIPEVYKYDPVTQTGTGSLVKDSVLAAKLVVYYSTWFGDSLNACRMSVYELDKKLEKNRYTNIDPEEYYNRFNSASLLGRKAYSAYDATVPDSIRYATDIYGEYTYYPNVSFTLDRKEFGEDRILKVYREHPEYFKNSKAFIDNVFKGVYIKSDYGDGTILYIDRVDLQLQLCFHYINDTTGVALKKQDGTDSIYNSMKTLFASTKEVVQANEFLNSDMIKVKAEEKSHTYIKSPAGIFTEAQLPYEAIHEDLASDTLNAVKLSFNNYSRVSKYEFSMGIPSEVLLIRKQDFKEFFESNNVIDNVTSYTATHGAVVANQYTFENIARLVTTCIEEKMEAKKEAQKAAGSSWNEVAWEEKWSTDEATKDWDKVLLIPVTVTYDVNNSSTITGIQNDLKPGYAKLQGGEEGDALKLEVTYTRFNN
ncbi:MAG: DUF4270 domain-containing protein [Bacteroides sp.]|nr:DUF4270 domain-containing protein [Bacteroides sp.]